ncbi:MAG TPA: TrkH family potassium uptake protein, partial [Syntrophales bacterium]|nr:TrkH family potassium uptake protein [Syntrophales bacterium]
MNTKNIFYILGTLVFFLGLTMLIPLACSLYYREGDINAFLYSIAITIGIGALFYFLLRPGKEKISLTHKEGFLIVATGWFLAATFGSLPYMLYGILPHFSDAFFDSISGFTTT